MGVASEKFYFHCGPSTKIKRLDDLELYLKRENKKRENISRKKYKKIVTRKVMVEVTKKTMIRILKAVIITENYINYNNNNNFPLHHQNNNNDGNVNISK